MNIAVDFKRITIGQVITWLISLGIGIVTVTTFVLVVKDLKDNAVTKEELTTALNPVITKVDDIAQAREAAVTGYMEERAANRAVREEIPQVKFTLDLLKDQAAKLAATQDTKDDATNKRIDRVVDSLNEKVDKLVDSVNALTTKVEVMSGKLASADQRSWLFETPSVLTTPTMADSAQSPRPTP